MSFMQLFGLLRICISSSFKNTTNILQDQLTYLSWRTCTSREFSSKVVRSEMVSEAVVPLMVSSRKMVPAPSSSSCLIRCVFSRSSWVRSMLHLKHNEIHSIREKFVRTAKGEYSVGYKNLKTE